MSQRHNSTHPTEWQHRVSQIPDGWVVVKEDRWNSDRHSVISPTFKAQSQAREWMIRHVFEGAQ